MSRDMKTKKEEEQEEEEDETVNNSLKALCSCKQIFTHVHR